MKTPQEIEVLAWERLEEAKLLYEGKKFDGAFYLLGYAVELMLYLSQLKIVLLTLPRKGLNFDNPVR